MLSKIRKLLHQSLRARLIAASVLPLFAALPLLFAALHWIIDAHTGRLLENVALGKLSSARNYLDQVRNEAGIRINQLVKSERLLRDLMQNQNQKEIEFFLSSTARSNGFDFLILTTADGLAIASNEGIRFRSPLPELLTLKQSGLGLSTATYEIITADEIKTLTGFAGNQREYIPNTTYKSLDDAGAALLVTASAHLPLSNSYPNTILFGGVILNNNVALIERMRNVIFPTEENLDSVRGETTIYAEHSLVNSTLKKEQENFITIAEKSIIEAVRKRNKPWLGMQTIGDQSYFSAYGSVTDSRGQHVGMIGVSFSDTPYRQAFSVALSLIFFVFFLTIAAVSLIFLKVGTEIQGRLNSVIETMRLIMTGQRGARVDIEKQDEIGKLCVNFNSLLKQIEDQENKLIIDQEIIQEEASRRKALFENERDGVVVLDHNGHALEINSSLRSMLGYSSEEMAGMHISRWISSHTRHQLMKDLDKLDSNGNIFEATVRSKFGKIFDAEISLSAANLQNNKFFIASLRDITERKKNLSEIENYRSNLERLVKERTAELALKSSQLEAVFSISPDGLLSFNQSHEILFANNAFYSMTGLKPDDVIGRKQDDFFAYFTKSCGIFPGISEILTAQPTTKSRINAGEPNFEFNVMNPSKRRIQMICRNTSSETVSQILYFRDITKQDEIDRMKSDFLSTAAHELRTPMTSIHGFSEVLLTQRLDEETRKDLLLTIFRQSSLISSIINELLDLARIEARQGKDFQIKELDFQKIVKDAVAAHKKPPTHDAPVVHYSPEQLIVLADADKMQQALGNIISNAYKYTPGIGLVEIFFESKVEDGRTFIGVAIKDQGIGMTEEQQKLACERFYRADTSGKIPGTGLGLSIVKEIIELHGGTINIESALGKGSKITLWLPAA